MIRKARLLLRLFWGGLAIILIGLALLIEAGRQLIPYAEHWREDVEFYLTRQFGQQVTLGQIEAKWEGMTPELGFIDLQIMSASAEPVLQIGRARVQLDLLRSLRDFDWRLRRMEIDSVDASIVQAEDGRWQLAGFKPATERKPFQLDPLQMLLYSDFVEFGNISLAFDFRSGRKTGVGLTSLLLQNDKQFHRLTAELDLPEKDDALTFVYEGWGTPGRKGFTGAGYLELEGYPVADSVAFAAEQLAGRAGIQDGLLSTQLWLQSSFNQPLTFEGQLQYSRQQPQDASVPEAITSDFSGNWHSLSGWQFNLQNTQVTWQQQVTETMDAIVRGQFGRPDISLQLSRLDLRYWQDYLARAEVMPEPVRRILSELNVRGEMSNVHITLPLENPAAFLLRANIHQLGVDDWKGAPGVEHLNGYLQASALSGLVQIDSEQGLRMHFPKVYRQAFEFASARGEVAWQVLPEENQVLVNSGLLSMQGDLGEVNGYFYLDAPLKRDSRLSELVLQLGLQSSAVEHQAKLVPFVLPDTIQAWLDSALLQGDVPSAGFVLQGYFGRPLAEARDTPRSIQLALNVDRASLAFHQQWPELTDLSGFLSMDAPVVEGWIESGKFLGNQLTTTTVQVTANPGAEGQLLRIRGNAGGDAESGWKVLTTTPLREHIGAALDGWQLSGDLSTRVALDIPLQADQSGQYQNVSVVLQDASLALDTPQLTFSKLAGTVNYESGKGLSSDKLQAVLWGEPVRAQINASGGRSGAAGATEISFRSQVNFAELARWSRRPELLFLEGKSLLAGVVSIAADGVDLRARSYLKGVSIDLPQPYGKQAAERRELNLSIPVHSDGFALQLDYDGQLFANLQVPQDKPVYGSIGLGAAAAERNGGIWIIGTLAQLDGRQWLPVIERYTQLSEFMSGVDKPEEDKSRVAIMSNEDRAAGRMRLAAAPRTLLRLDARVEEFNWDDWQLTETQVGGGQIDNGWEIRLDNDNIAGDIRLYSDQQVPEIDLDYLRWSFAEEMPEDEVEVTEQAQPTDLLKDFDPTTLQPLKLRLQEIRINDKDYGQWSMQLLPDSSGLLVRDIQAVFRHLMVTGANQQQTAEGVIPRSGAELYWQKNGASVETTRFKGVIRGRNLADVTDAWALPRLLESKSLQLQAALDWPGSPAMFGVNSLQGELDLDVRDGRFYQSTGQASSAFLRLVGLFNFDSWTRRLQLDFSDVYKGGMPFEKIDGNLQFANGTILLNKPLEVTNPSSKMQMGGRINLVDETLDTSLVATLPVGGNATFLTALIAGLPAAAGVYLASKIFEKQMDKVASLSYSMKGPWADPKIRFDKLFDNKAAEKASKERSQE